MGKKFDMLALGEVLLRLSPEGNERLTQGTRFEKQLGGAELNVAVGAANLGLTTGIISKIPSHAIGNYAKREIRRNGVDTDYLAGDWEFTITNMAQILVNRRWFTTASILL